MPLIIAAAIFIVCVLCVLLSETGNHDDKA